MKKFVKKLIHDPLFHFLIIGAGLFLLFELTKAPDANAPNRIVVDAGQVEQLSAQFKRTWIRPPTKDELAGLIESYIRDEIYYREAMAMGLDQNDPQIGRRMRTKLEFILEDLSAEEARDEELSAFLQQNPDRFRVDPKVSFQQLYLNPDKRQNLVADAADMVKRLRSGTTPETLGDPTMVGQEYTLATQSEIARSFGEAFSEELVELEPGNWTGPLYSGLGGHLVKVSERVEGRLPELAEIRGQVEREYLAQRRQQLKDMAYAKLREGYQCVVEPPKAPEGKPGEVMAAISPVEAAQ